MSLSRVLMSKAASAQTLAVHLVGKMSPTTWFRARWDILDQKDTQVAICLQLQYQECLDAQESALAHLRAARPVDIAHSFGLLTIVVDHTRSSNSSLSNSSTMVVVRHTEPVSQFCHNCMQVGGHAFCFLDLHLLHATAVRLRFLGAVSFS